MDAALVILDGWGLGSEAPERLLDGRPRPTGGRDAVSAADTPTFDALVAEGAYGTLDTSGRSVGLPEGQMGNSEVGHLTVGAGRAVEQAAARIDDAVTTDELGAVDAIDAALGYAEAHDGRLHLLGLTSDGGVHADARHLHALVETAADRGVPAVTHAITDGRDTAPTSGVEHVRALAQVADDAGTGHVATVTGRYYAMDRDENWARTRRAYDAVVRRVADHEAATAVEAVEASYDRGDTDEFVEPTLVAGGPALADGDAVVVANFRADRARQLTRMLADIDPVWPFETDPPTTHVTTMTEYDRTFGLPVAFPPRDPDRTLGEVLAAHDRTQLRIAESEKYAHVTYFLNGGREVEFDGEIRRIVDSPAVSTYDQQPEMSAPEVTDTALSVVESEAPDAMVLNYANPDMVGHTGDFAAARAAVEAVDGELGRLVPALRAAGATVLVTADHGNAEDMGTPEAPHTAHTTNPVPAVLLDPEGPTPTGGRLRQGGLADVAPTLLSVMGVAVPDPMTGSSLRVE
jgi:2,3-bisphosphoglycerate-independent phosphoglycerate mutase